MVTTNPTDQFVSVSGFSISLTGALVCTSGTGATPGGGAGRSQWGSHTRLCLSTTLSECHTLLM